MKHEYYVFEISVLAEDTEKKLNKLAKEGWRLVCSYARNNKWLIVERKNETKRTKKKG